MGKIQLTIPLADKEKFEVAAHFSGLAINQAVAVGNEIVVDTTYRTGNQLLSTGIRMGTLKDSEIKGLLKVIADKQAQSDKKKPQPAK